MRSLLCSSLLLSGSVFSQTIGYLTNFNEPNYQQLLLAIQQKQLHIVQLGDSHTASDTMTDALRTQLQHKLGNGGMGWAMPMYFNGQRMAKFGYDNVNWQPIYSRGTHDENYTLGGMLAKPLEDGATLTIKAKHPENVQKITVSIRQTTQDNRLIGIDATGKTFSIEAPIKNGQWQTTQFTATLPFTIQAERPINTALGGWWALNPDNKGAVVSALGINGSELAHWERWNTQAWQQELATIRPQLIILAYGTNEAYNNVDAQTVQKVLTQRIQQIRQTSPQSAIMIISAPEILKNTRKLCGTRPTHLSTIQKAQRQVAEQQHTFYWDWQQAMGGQCSMNRWIQQGKALKDGVHFSQSGYQQLGKLLANDILQLANIISVQKTTTIPPNNTVNENYSSAINEVAIPTTLNTTQPISNVQATQNHMNYQSSAHICWYDEQRKYYCYTAPYRY